MSNWRTMKRHSTGRLRARDELGTAAFRVTNADGTPSESVVNRAIFDAIYLSRVVYYPRKSEHLCT
jgi:hypothetical protein